MADELIPQDVRDFIQRHIDSIAQLEALMLLFKQPGERWTRSKVATHLYISDEQASVALEQLCADALVVSVDDLYGLNDDRDAGQRTLVERLAVHYSRHLIPVTNLVHGKPSAARAFAAAFKLRKDR